MINSRFFVALRMTFAAVKPFDKKEKALRTLSLKPPVGIKSELFPAAFLVLFTAAAGTGLIASDFCPLF